jgi:hypothetical protein
LGQYVRLITLAFHLWVNTFDWLRSFHTFESIRSIDYARYTPLGQYVLIDYARFPLLGQYIRLITFLSHNWVNTSLWLRSFLMFGSIRSYW